MNRFLPVFAAIVLSVALFVTGVTIGFYMGQEDGIREGRSQAEQAAKAKETEELVVHLASTAIVNGYLADGWRVRSANSNGSAVFYILTRPKR